MFDLTFKFPHETILWNKNLFLQKQIYAKIKWKIAFLFTLVSVTRWWSKKVA